MKRPSRPPVLEPRPSPRRRALSEEERELWDLVAKHVKPLRKHRAVKAHAPRAEPSPGTQVTRTSLPARPVAAAPAPRAAKPSIPPLAPLGKRERTKLSRGRSEIDARLDLHGMTQMRAHRALAGFLHRARQDGLTFVLVITGKGRSGGESGVLRRQVPEWLSLPEFRAFVVGFEEAAIGHGGEGALYVRIRRARG
ncbi:MULTISPECIES: Smr/MutS family protein [Bradyrhizobium]|uniref:Smr/MutS family protein n=1 Tax=Bradyrhizobium TaxID=374 RepID=UPI00155E43B9|nr:MULTISPECIES: Smr/MutS family protein [Bradyrhizobium]MDD1521747.1 DNA mismatch repair protein MutS [Bradyrhizobium sp. WBAH30]MDD1544593.1 DNA mismatch repair protein MutS [Bradyrhizobium sp. WBAH41]MDD1559356.1 DNA mismatch repair protein MutS [Bradyrhizobium sp. WBAH23]MDD1566871.1 DNA mismatch repair protein MutS [Bradyrhizobium sp. WBAH33]MDD1592889.1 DNA mismatch repair protein MutS [Bradyrhizobium sp. WBAH42]